MYVDIETQIVLSAHQKLEKELSDLILMDLVTIEVLNSS